MALDNLTPLARQQLDAINDIAALASHARVSIQDQSTFPYEMTDGVLKSILAAAARGLGHDNAVDAMRHARYREREDNGMYPEDAMTDDNRISYHDYETERIGGGNPYYRCVECKASDPQINGRLKGHFHGCEYVKRKLQDIEREVEKGL